MASRMGATVPRLHGEPQRPAKTQTAVGELALRAATSNVVPSGPLSASSNGCLGCGPQLPQQQFPSRDWRNARPASRSKKPQLERRSPHRIGQQPRAFGPKPLWEPCAQRGTPTTSGARQEARLLGYANSTRRGAHEGDLPRPRSSRRPCRESSRWQRRATRQPSRHVPLKTLPRSE